MRDTIDMAREAGLIALNVECDPSYLPIIKRFEAIVRADERSVEREACAVIAETPISGEQDDITMQAKDRVAAAIRARGETK